MTAQFETLWDAVKQQIVELDLEGLTANTIRQQQFPANVSDNQLHNGALLCPANEQEGASGTNRSTDIGYGFSLTLLQKSNSQLGKAQLPSLMTWRETIRHYATFIVWDATLGGVTLN